MLSDSTSDVLVTSVDIDVKECEGDIGSAISLGVYLILFLFFELSKSVYSLFYQIHKRVRNLSMLIFFVCVFFMCVCVTKNKQEKFISANSSVFLR